MSQPNYRQKVRSCGSAKRRQGPTWQQAQQKQGGQSLCSHGVGRCLGKNIYERQADRVWSGGCVRRAVIVPRQHAARGSRRIAGGSKASWKRNEKYHADAVKTAADRRAGEVMRSLGDRSAGCSEPSTVCQDPDGHGPERDTEVVKETKKTG